MSEFQYPNEAAAENCQLCQLPAPATEELINHRYCERCHQQLEQAYNWLQGPLVSEEEMGELHQIMLDLTDISKLQLD